jgi:hypothetical protein
MFYGFICPFFRLRRKHPEFRFSHREVVRQGQIKAQTAVSRNMDGLPDGVHVLPPMRTIIVLQREGNNAAGNFTVSTVPDEEPLNTVPASKSVEVRSFRIAM